MKLVVVDASVLFACLAKDGRTRDVFMTTTASLVAPPFLLEEAKSLLPKAAHRAGIHEDILRGVFDHLVSFICVMTPDSYLHKRAEGQRLCRDADAWGDDEYVALALALDAPIWTFDHDFGRIPGIRIATTQELDVGSS